MSLVAACELAELGSLPLAVTLGDVDLALVKVDDEVFAITDECSHGKVALSEGDVDGCEIECYLHGARFDLRTGRPTSLPATEPVPVYPTSVVDGVVMVDLDSPIDPSSIAPQNIANQNVEN